MKKISLVFILLVCFFVTSAAAGSAKVQTVAEAKASGIDTGVSLTGQVLKVINDKSFLFSDGTGELLVHTDNGDLLKDSLVQARIDVTGMIVQDFMYTEIQAASITVHN